MRAFSRRPDSGFGRSLRTTARPAATGNVPLSDWAQGDGGLWTRRAISRRDLLRFTAGTALAAPLLGSLAACTEEDWRWFLSVLKDAIELTEAAIGKYETRNTGENQTDVEITTSALRVSDGEEVDVIVQVANVPADGQTYEILTPNAQNGGLMVPEPGAYRLRGVIPAASARVESQDFTARA